MKNTSLLLIFLFLLPGCIGAKRYARHVERAYSATAEARVDSVPGISVIYDGPPVAEPVVQVRKGDYRVLPALVYWQIKEEFKCTLNPHLPVDIFRQYVYKNAGELGLAEKLGGGRRLVITVHKIPAQFRYMFRDDIVVLLVVALQFYEQSIFPDENDLSVSYALYEGDKLVKGGSAYESNHDLPLTSNNTTRKKITKAYVRQYRRNLTDMVTKCMLEIAQKV